MKNDSEKWAEFILESVKQTEEWRSLLASLDEDGSATDDVDQFVTRHSEELVTV